MTFISSANTKEMAFFTNFWTNLAKFCTGCARSLDHGVPPSEEFLHELNGTGKIFAVQH